MNVQNIMTRDVAYCTPDKKLNEVARMMVEHDCGEIPVVESQGSKRLVGVITDRDIVCRAVADNCQPSECSVGEYMTIPVVSVTQDATLDDCCQKMEENMIRRIPVVDQNGCCCGIVSLADIACKMEGHIDHLVEQVSQPTDMPSMVASKL